MMMRVIPLSRRTLARRTLVPSLAALMFAGLAASPRVWAADGTGLDVAFFANENVAGAPVLSAQGQLVNVNWGTAAPGASVPADHFSARWSGYLMPRFTESYTLIASVDDVVRLWIDDVKVMDVDDWKNAHSYTFAAQAGRKYAIRMEMADHAGGAAAKLEWSSASEARQVIPLACLYPSDIAVSPIADVAVASMTGIVDVSSAFALPAGDAWTWHLDAASAAAGLTISPQGVIGGFPKDGLTYANVVVTVRGGSGSVASSNAFAITVKAPVPAPANGTGLDVAFFANETVAGAPVLTASDQQVNSNWGSGSPGASVPADHFSARWSGYLETRYTEDYTLIASVDDVVRLWIDDVKVMDVDDWKNAHSYAFAAQAGRKYAIRMEMADHAGGAAAKLEWSSRHEGRQVIPLACLYPSDIAVSPVADVAVAHAVDTVDVSSSFALPTGGAWAWHLDDASVAAGLTISPRGVISGFPNAGATYTNIVVTVRGESGAIASSNAFTVTVAPVAPGDGTGLMGYYYPSEIIQAVPPVLTRVDAAINFDWGMGAPADNMPSDNFSVIWTGTITARYTGWHSFRMTGHTDHRIHVGTVDVLNDFGDLNEYASVYLVAGQTVPIWAEMYEIHLEAAATMLWTQPGQVEEVVPTSQLHPVPMPDIVPGGGMGLRAAYFPGPSFTGTPTLQTDATVDFSWPTVPLDGFPADDFSVRWQGKIIAPLDEDVTLLVQADDGVRLWLDGKLVIDDWTDGSRTRRCTLPGGAGVAHDLRLDYYERTFAAEVHLDWESAHLPRRAVPTTALIPADAVTTPAPTSGAGLSAAYYANENLNGTPVLARVQNINVNWGTGSPHAAIPADHFSARWSGQIQTRFTEDYTLILTADDGVRVWLDGQLVIDDWTGTATKTRMYTFPAEAGHRYALHIDYVEHTGNASATLEWTSASEARQIVPEACLYPNDLDITVPAASAVSPACIEGLHGPALTVAAGTGAVHPLGESRFYVDQPLSADAATAVQIAAGTGTATGGITWTPTPLADATVVVRPGDALLIQAVAAGTWQIQTNCATWREPAPIVAGDRVPVTFPAPGTYLVEQTDDSGVTTATLTVTVPSIATTGRIPVSTQYTRVKDITYGDASDKSLITWTSSDTWAVIGTGTTPSDAPATSKRYTVWADQNRPSWMVGRIGGATGPVMTALEVRPFVMRTDAEKFIKAIKQFADGSILCEENLIMEPQVRKLDVKMSIIVAGATYDDSTTLRWVSTSTDFVGIPENPNNGHYTLRLIRPPSVLTGLCHSWQIFDDSVAVSR